MADASLERSGFLSSTTTPSIALGSEDPTFLSQPRHKVSFFSFLLLGPYPNATYVALCRASRANFSNLIPAKKKAYSSHNNRRPVPVAKPGSPLAGRLSSKKRADKSPSLIYYIYHATSLRLHLALRVSLSSAPPLPPPPPNPSTFVRIHPPRAVQAVMSTEISHETPKDGTIVSVVVSLVSISIISSFLSTSAQPTPFCETTLRPWLARSLIRERALEWNERTVRGGEPTWLTADAERNSPEARRRQAVAKVAVCHMA